MQSLGLTNVNINKPILVEDGILKDKSQTQDQLLSSFGTKKRGGTSKTHGKEETLSFLSQNPVYLGLLTMTTVLPRGPSGEKISNSPGSPRLQLRGRNVTQEFYFFGEEGGLEGKTWEKASS